MRRNTVLLALIPFNVKRSLTAPAYTYSVPHGREHDTLSLLLSVLLGRISMCSRSSRPADADPGHRYRVFMDFDVSR